MKGRKIILGLVSATVGLLLGEVFLSLVAPQVHRRPRMWEFDDRLGWRHVPAAVGRLVTPEFEVEIATNADGLRDGDHARQREEGSWRLLAFGDSFVEGWGVSLEASVSKQLERRLQEAKPDRRVEVINFGVAGYGTDQEMLLFEGSGRHYRPDKVLVFFYANDLWNNASKKGIGAERGYKPYFQVSRNGRLHLAGLPVEKIPQWDESWLAGQPWRRRLSRYLHRHWHFYVLLEKALAPSEISSGLRQQFYEGLYGEDEKGRWTPVWELTGRILKAFAERVEQAGAEMLLIYVPAIVQVEDQDWQTKRDLHGLVGEFDMRKPNRQLAGFTVRYDISFLDLYPSFKEAAGETKLYFRDSHWNEQGHALAAELISDYLAREWVNAGEHGE